MINRGYEFIRQGKEREGVIQLIEIPLNHLFFLKEVSHIPKFSYCILGVDTCLFKALHKIQLYT